MLKKKIEQPDLELQVFDTLSLDTYVTIADDPEKIGLLIVSPVKPTSDYIARHMHQLLEAWEVIDLELQNLLLTPEEYGKVVLQFKITIKTAKYNFIVLCSRILANAYDLVIAELLRLELPDLPLTEESLQNDLITIKKKLPVLSYDLDKMNHKLKTVIEQDEEGQEEEGPKQTARQRITRILVSISTLKKYRLNISDMTVTEFVMHYRDFKEYIKQATKNETE